MGKLVSTHAVQRYMWTYRVLFLLDLDNGAVLEGPLDHVGLLRGAFDELALVERRPELAEVLELDQVPDIAEWRLNDGRLAHGGGSGDASRHCGLCSAIDFVWYYAVLLKAERRLVMMV